MVLKTNKKMALRESKSTTIQNVCRCPDQEILKYILQFLALNSRVLPILKGTQAAIYYFTSS